MNTLTMINYVIIGEQPDGNPVTLKYPVPATAVALYKEAIEEKTLAAFEALYPEARGVKGGCGWSSLYQARLT